MKKYFILQLAVCLMPLFSKAQMTEYEVRQMVDNAPEQQLVVESSRMLQENYFYFSEIVTDKLLQLKPDNANYNYRKGYIILDSRQDWVSALPYLEKATTKISKNYDMYSAKEDGAPTDVYYHIGRCYHLDQQLDKAIEYYNKFIAESSAKSELVPKAKLRIQQCNVAKELIANPKKATCENLGSTVNTKYPEYAPTVSIDGTALYFTSRRQWDDQSTDEFRDPQYNQYPEDIYVTYTDFKGNWTKPERLPFCDGQLNEATVTISADERRVYTYEDRTGNGDIYTSDFHNNRFQALEVLKIKGVNTKYWETHLTVTPDGQNIYFVSDRPGGMGGRDIYRIVKLPDGNWSEPINLGPTINTAYDEDAPFIAVDNKTLYFSSNGPKSMGEFDIMLSVRDNNNNWSEPINLGYPINSTGDDVFYTTTADGQTGYLASFRKGGFGEKDIYEIKTDEFRIQQIAILKGKIRTSDNSPLPESVVSTIRCTTCDDQTAYYLSPRMRDGVFMYGLKPCETYELSFKFDSLSQSMHTETFSTDCDLAYDEIYKEVVLDVKRKRIIPIITYSLDGLITDIKTGEKLVNSTVEISDKDGKLLETLTTDANGKFKSGFLKDFVFGDTLDIQFKVIRDPYLTQTFEWKKILADSNTFHVAYGLEKPDVGIDLAKTLKLNPIYFDLNKADIRPDAKKELDKIVKIMNDNPTIQIELGSHTDCRGSAEYNMELSDRRAKASAEYIKSRITNPERIYGRGYGESMLVNDCGCEGNVESHCSEAQHQANRRTEFRIVANQK